MQSGPHTAIATPLVMKATEPPHREPRLRLKPEAPITGYVDGAWWPRSRDLSAELPALLAALTVRLARIERVSYHLTTWSPARRRLNLDGRIIRLDGFRSQHTDIVTVIGATDRPRLTLLVVPPETDPNLAHQIMTTAAHRDNVDTADTLLATRDLPAAPHRISPTRRRRPPSAGRLTAVASRHPPSRNGPLGELILGSQAQAGDGRRVVGAGEADRVVRRAGR